MFACSAFLFLEQRDRALIWLAACAGYGTLGIIDDVRGAKAVKGLRGHLRAAIHDKVVTTGLIKAIGGVALAIWVARHLVPSSFPIQLLAVCVVALCANAINLLDLRPGRAGATFLVLAFPLVVVALLGEEAGAPPLLLVVIPTLLVWEADARGVVMMGDTGSNLLGAALGMSLVAEASVPCMALVVIALIVLHAYAERRSLTKVIENSPLLNKLDQLTGVR
jgi:UDP-N-acetylmuramyl pentapeptide phosphotransferase/UDP-N-acetylglucosamine-1-phosphate transferase